MDIFIVYNLVFYIGLVTILFTFVLLFWYKKKGIFNLRTSVSPIGLFLVGLGMILSVKLWLFIGFGIVCIGALMFVGDHILQMIYFFKNRP